MGSQVRGLLGELSRAGLGSHEGVVTQGEASWLEGREELGVLPAAEKCGGLCLALGNHRASFHPTWLPCVSGWYGEPGVRCLVFTSLTYLWPLIFEGLSCVPTLPSGPIMTCVVNQTPLPDTSLLVHPSLSHLAPEVDSGPSLP